MQAVSQSELVGVRLLLKSEQYWSDLNRLVNAECDNLPDLLQNFQKLYVFLVTMRDRITCDSSPNLNLFVCMRERIDGIVAEVADRAKELLSASGVDDTEWNRVLPETAYAEMRRLERKVVTSKDAGSFITLAYLLFILYSVIDVMITTSIEPSERIVAMWLRLAIPGLLYLLGTCITEIVIWDANQAKGALQRRFSNPEHTGVVSSAFDQYDIEDLVNYLLWLRLQESRPSVNGIDLYTMYQSLIERLLRLAGEEKIRTAAKRQGVDPRIDDIILEFYGPTEEVSLAPATVPASV